MTQIEPSQKSASKQPPLIARQKQQLTKKIMWISKPLAKIYQQAKSFCIIYERPIIIMAILAGLASFLAIFSTGFDNNSNVFLMLLSGLGGALIAAILLVSYFTIWAQKQPIIAENYDNQEQTKLLNDYEKLHDRYIAEHERMMLWHQIMDHHGDILIRRDHNGHIRFANDAFYELFGLSPHDVIGTDFTPQIKAKLSHKDNPSLYDIQIDTRKGSALAELD